MSGVIEGKLLVVGQSRDDVFRLDLAVDTPSGVTHERVSGLAEASAAFSVLRGVNAGSLVRAHYVQNGKYKNVDLTQTNPIQVIVRAARPVSPDYRVFGGKTPTRSGWVWLVCLKLAAFLRNINIDF